MENDENYSGLVYMYICIPFNFTGFFKIINFHMNILFSWGFSLDEDDEDSQSQTEEDSESEYDSDGLRAYTVANNNDFVPVEVKSKVKTKGGKQGQFQEEVQAEVVEQGSTTTTASSEEGVLPQNQPKEVIPQEDPWSQAQQKAFEAAIKQFPKGATERWERIANKVPGKTKDQCIQRFKTLAEMVKKKKEAVVVESWYDFATTEYLKMKWVTIYILKLNFFIVPRKQI